MALTNEELTDIWARYQNITSRAGIEVATSKDDLRTAVEDVETWIDANQVSYNTALPEPYKTDASAQEKALMLSLVAAKMYEVI